MSKIYNTNDWISAAKRLPMEDEMVIATIVIHYDADDEGNEESDTEYIGYGSFKDGFYVGESGMTRINDESVKLLAWKPNSELWNELSDLSTRAYNCIRRTGAKNKKQLIDALQNWVEMPNCGTTTMEELERFCGKKLQRKKVFHAYQLDPGGRWVWSYKIRDDTTPGNL